MVKRLSCHLGSLSLDVCEDRAHDACVSKPLVTCSGFPSVAAGGSFLSLRTLPSLSRRAGGTGSTTLQGSPAGAWGFIP